MRTSATTTPTYCVNLIQPGVDFDQVEILADAGKLQRHQLRALNCVDAEQEAHRLTGLPVHSSYRIEPVVTH